MNSLLEACHYPSIELTLEMTESMRILIVEDEPRMLELLRQGLYEHGFTVMTAADGETGLLFPCGNVTALADALARLADDAALRHRLGEAGARRVRDHFAIERYVTGVENALAEVLEAKR